MVTFCNYNALKNVLVEGNKNNNLTTLVKDLHNVLLKLLLHYMVQQLGE